MRKVVAVTPGGLVIPRPILFERRELSSQQLELVETAEAALRVNAHNSVEEIRVGTALRIMDGSVKHGANMRARNVSRHMHAEEIAMYKLDRSGYFGGIQAVATISNMDGPKPLCDTCSRMFLARAAETGVDTEIILSSSDMHSFSIVHVTDMFANRNIPHGEVEYNLVIQDE